MTIGMMRARRERDLSEMGVSVLHRLRLLPRVVTALAEGVNAVGLYSVVDCRWWTKADA